MTCLRNCVHGTWGGAKLLRGTSLYVYVTKSDYTADQNAFSLHSRACCILREIVLKSCPYPCTNDPILRKHPTNALYTLTPLFFFHSVNSYMLQPSEWSSWESIDTFCEQGQQNACPDVQSRIKSSTLYVTCQLSNC